MGILKVGAGALKSVLEDQWREYFYCPSMEADVLVKKGENRKSKRSYNTKGSDNLISNGSIIAASSKSTPSSSSTRFQTGTATYSAKAPLRLEPM